MCAASEGFYGLHTGARFVCVNKSECIIYLSILAGNIKTKSRQSFAQFDILRFNADWVGLLYVSTLLTIKFSMEI